MYLMSTYQYNFGLLLNFQNYCGALFFGVNSHVYEFLFTVFFEERPDKNSKPKNDIVL